MKRRSSRLLAIESPFPDANVRLRLLEPPDSCHETLRERVYSGSYDKPFVVDNGPRRFLHFDFGAIQSVMELRLRLAVRTRCTPAASAQNLPARKRCRFHPDAPRSAEQRSLQGGCRVASLEATAKRVQRWHDSTHRTPGGDVAMATNRKDTFEWAATSPPIPRW